MTIPRRSWAPWFADHKAKQRSIAARAHLVSFWNAEVEARLERHVSHSFGSAPYTVEYREPGERHEPERLYRRLLSITLAVLALIGVILWSALP